MEGCERGAGKEWRPEELGQKFNRDDFMDFVFFLRQQLKINPGQRFTIVADWAGVDKTRAAKALLDQYGSRLNIESMTIRATRPQFETEVNAFQSGLRWEVV